MVSRTTERFRKAFSQLPKQVQQQAEDAFQQFKEDPFYPIYVSNACIPQGRSTLSGLISILVPLAFKRKKS